MHTIRIVVAGSSPMLTGILSDISASEPDFDFLGDVSMEEALDGLSGRRADVLIVCVTEADNRGLAGSLLIASPGIRVLMITRTADRAVLYELHPLKTELGEVSPQGIVRAIRGSRARVC